VGLSMWPIYAELSSEYGLTSIKSWGENDPIDLGLIPEYDPEEPVNTTTLSVSSDTTSTVFSLSNSTLSINFALEYEAGAVETIIQNALDDDDLTSIISLQDAASWDFMDDLSSQLDQLIFQSTNLTIEFLTQDYLVEEPGAPNVLAVALEINDLEEFASLDPAMLEILLQDAIVAGDTDENDENLTFGDADGPVQLTIIGETEVTNAEFAVIETLNILDLQDLMTII